AGFAELLMIDDHDVAADADLVRMPAVRHVDARQQPRIAWIGHVDDRGAAGRALVPDIHRRAFDPDLAAAWTIETRDQRGIGPGQQSSPASSHATAARAAARDAEIGTHQPRRTTASSLV